MITEASKTLRDRIREPWATCGTKHPVGFVCAACNALGVARAERNRADTEEIYRLEREAEGITIT